MFFYSQFSLSGKLGFVNQNEVTKYYKKAADKGNILSMKNYATILRNGDGIQTDKKKQENIIEIKHKEEMLYQ